LQALELEGYCQGTIAVRSENRGEIRTSFAMCIATECLIQASEMPVH
jgi:hypothetical protein